MNFSKGKRTKGRGSSFRGALRYYLHDQEADTADRVGRIELLNLFTDDPQRAWREMAATAEAADQLKARAGIKATGRKNTKPVYCFALSWHPDERPTPQHMIDTAKDALKTLGLLDRQAVIVQHTDRDHSHVHVLVNLIHPDTGQSAKLYNDEKILDRWAFEYERRHGVYSHDRAAKHQARMQADKPPKRNRPPCREEWEARKRRDSQAEAEAAAAIRAGIDSFTARLKAAQAHSCAARKAESDALWQAYQAKRRDVFARYKLETDAIWKHRRDPSALPFSIQGFRDWRDTLEWRTLRGRLLNERRQFLKRERSLLGTVSNAVLAAGLSGRLSLVFNMLANPAARLGAFEEHQALRKKQLADKQRRRRKHRADLVLERRRAELDALAKEFAAAREALKASHDSEIAANKAAWQAFGAERRRLWHEHGRRFPREDRTGWTRRRSKAERIADGSYKQRNRKRG